MICTAFTNAKSHDLRLFKESQTRIHADDKKLNRKISSERMCNEHAIRFIKHLKILSERYRNRRKRFAKHNLISLLLIRLRFIIINNSIFVSCIFRYFRTYFYYFIYYWIIIVIKFFFRNKFIVLIL